MVKICALASGSNGNCYYIGNEQKAVLIDIGISNRQLKKRLVEVGLSIKKIQAVFITHEHTDHVKGLNSITKVNPIQAYATSKTYQKTRKDYRSDKINYFKAGDVIEIGGIKIHSFSKTHDAVDPVSFRIEIDDFNIAVLTDLGNYNDTIKEHVSVCDAIFLEVNYEHDWLMKGKYPLYLKNRVASDYGHLSNQQALELVNSIDNNKMKAIFLSHISADNNSHQIASDTFKLLANQIQILLTSRHGPSQLVELQ